MSNTILRRVGRVAWSIVLVGLLSLGPAHAQSPETVHLPSRNYEDGRPILVHLPAGYDDETRSYPVLYVLNEEDNFHWAVQIVDLLSEHNEIDAMIVVGLPEQGDYGRDNYPFVSQESSDPSPAADRYANFLRTEVIPHVDARYRTEDSRFIVGHSLSGLFVANLFRTAPNEFDFYIAVSPSLQYAPQLVDMIDATLASAEDPGALYFTIGELEHVLIQNEFTRMRDVLEKHARTHPDIQIDAIAYNNHRSAAYSGLFNALSWAYADWGTRETMPAELGGVDGIVAHYDKLSQRLGYEIKPREGDLAGMASFLLGRLDDPNGAAIGFQAELHFYPESERAMEGYKQALAARAED